MQNASTAFFEKKKYFDKRGKTAQYIKKINELSFFPYFN